MAAIFPVKTLDGGVILPTADATLYTDIMSADYSIGLVYIEFFSDAAASIPATPTTGTVSVFGSPSGNVWLTPAAGGVVQASTVSAPKGTYTPPYFSGGFVRGRIEMANITGASYAKISFWRQ